MNTARCSACNTVVRLPHARSRASHARCEECHRRAAGALQRPARWLTRDEVFAMLAPEPMPEYLAQPVEQTIAGVRYVGAVFQVMFWGELRSMQNWLTVRDPELLKQAQAFGHTLVGGKVRYIAESGEVVALYPQTAVPMLQAPKALAERLEADKRRMVEEMGGVPSVLRGEPTTPAGRVAVANWLLEDGKITTLAEYMAIVSGENTHEMGPVPTPAELLLRRGTTFRLGADGCHVGALVTHRTDRTVGVMRVVRIEQGTRAICDNGYSYDIDSGVLLLY